MHDEILTSTNDILSVPWNERAGQVVPQTDDVVMKNGAVRVTATYLYADMADSSGLAQSVADVVAARVMRSYVHMAVKVIRSRGGEIRSFDGDRVMGIFIGDAKNTNAVRAALGINYYVSQHLRASIKSTLPSTEKAGWTLHHGIGIDTGEALIVRGGARDNSDLISVGSAPNAAAKLSDLRSQGPTFISDGVFNHLRDDTKVHADGRERFTYIGIENVGGKSISVYGSSWYWRP
ncbi:adenylate/guanylate cyclase domain-containing protein [Modestobacter versicolor]|uniref:Adenylate/guanylate cyclase domain-containing protein n=1 Tax=Modestobacter versicolor TaxID=429133 RepID=A0A323VGR2_9ACTN|nr:adenylate/guanylate cyclase domain-containing protein [Modestobacter versicolor]